MIHLYTGDGKGKTTAAVGMAVRAAGCGRQVIFAQFMKGRDTGELHVLKELENVRILRPSEDFGFYGSMSGSDKERLTAVHNDILDSIREAVSAGQVFLAVLDEITYPVKWGLLDLDKLKEILACGNAELVCTGRDAAGFLLDRADYVTEMRCLRHPFEKGVPARRGVEY